MLTYRFFSLCVLYLSKTIVLHSSSQLVILLSIIPIALMKILNVAEKPSVAKSISNILSRNVDKTEGLNKFTPNYKFNHCGNEMIFTSLLGHLFTSDFVGCQDWNAVNPKVLFEAEIKKFVNKDQESVKKNIQNQAYNTELVIVWTDCDREGENIGKEIYDVIREKNKKIEIKRARFNAITSANILYALQNLTNINMKESEAVDARIELDLRIGSAFTRLQTLNVGKKMVLSYGSCQIPTLGFVVDRMMQIEKFVPEKYYNLNLVIKKSACVNGKVKNKQFGTVKNNETADLVPLSEKKSVDIFSWSRGSIFDKNLPIYMLKVLNKYGYCTIISKSTKEVQKTKPLPLRTVEFQKACASFFKISSSEIMKIAESLYTKGFISYPRTETDVFPDSFNYKEVINMLKADSSYKEYCEKLNDHDKFAYPRKGRNDDMAHSPIYPLQNGAGLQGNDRKIYDFVSRRFLACVSKNAIGEECNVTASVGPETFHISGLQIITKNYLEIYTYEKWNEKKILDYKPNTKIELVKQNDNLSNDLECPTKKFVEEPNLDKRFCADLCVEDKQTTPPTHLTEPELITLMDKNGIGTDATIAEHIQKIQDRKYAYKRNTFILATSLGYGLINGYMQIGLIELPKPFLRCKLEEDLKKICEGLKSKFEVVKSEIEIYKNFYDKLNDKFETIRRSIQDLDIDTQNKPPEDDNKTNDFTNKKNKKKLQKPDPIFDDFESAIKRLKSRSNQEYSKTNELNHVKVIKQISKDRKPLNGSKLCYCNKETKTNVVMKSGVNKNKEFFSCTNWPNGCEYFEWVDGSTISTKENKSNKDDKAVKCYCGYDTQTKISNTTQNKDRQFYCCKKAYKPCNYFQWVD